MSDDTDKTTIIPGLRPDDTPPLGTPVPQGRHRVRRGVQMPRWATAVVFGAPVAVAALAVGLVLSGWGTNDRPAPAAVSPSRTSPKVAPPPVLPSPSPSLAPPRTGRPRTTRPAPHPSTSSASPSRTPSPTARPSTRSPKPSPTSLAPPSPTPTGTDSEAPDPGPTLTILPEATHGE